MASNSDRAQRWMDVALGRTDRELAPNGNVFADGDTIFSYGRHFVLATIMRDRYEQPSWVLVNGDRYSVSTSQHQGIVRGVIASTHLDSIIVPFSALHAAGIAFGTIKPLEVRPDRTEVTPHSSPERPDPQTIWADLGDDGLWHWETRRHWLGDSLFSASVNGRRRRFLSSFDYQEAQPLYFLCELPRSSSAETVEQAYEDLKPSRVKAAEAQLRTVTRQGDMFAIPTTFSTREVKGMTPHGKGRIVKRPKLGLLGTNHTASEVIFATQGRVYARGLLYHQPGAWREPDHARRKMGDGKTWHLLVKNTVPTAAPERERIPA